MDCDVEVAEPEEEEEGDCESGFWLRVVEKTSEFSQSGLCLVMYTAVCAWVKKGRGEKERERAVGRLLYSHSYVNICLQLLMYIPGLNCRTNTKQFLVLLKMSTATL